MGHMTQQWVAKDTRQLRSPHSEDMNSNCVYGNSDVKSNSIYGHPNTTKVKLTAQEFIDLTLKPLIKKMWLQWGSRHFLQIESCKLSEHFFSKI